MVGWLMSTQVQQNARNFLTSCRAINFLRRIVFHGVNLYLPKSSNMCFVAFHQSGATLKCWLRRQCRITFSFICIVTIRLCCGTQHLVCTGHSAVA